MRRFFFILLLVALLTACTAKPVPPEKSAYVGEWQSVSESVDMNLVIHQDGNVSYRRQEGSTTTTVNAGIKDFEGDNFVVGFGPFSTTFEVSKPPHAEQGDWKMVVDGVELRRVR
jgi:hypothetical protein